MGNYSRVISTSGAWATGLVGTIGYTLLDAAGEIQRAARTTAGIAEISASTYAATATFDTAWGDVLVKWDNGAGDEASELLSGVQLAADALSYLPLLADADALAATLPSSRLTAYRAAEDADKLGALVDATSRIDSAMRYQGQKYFPAVTGEAQTLEFPRLARSGGSLPNVVANAFPAATLASEVYDWDADNNTAMVPRNVKLATLHEANSILDGQRAGTQAAQHDGLASQSIGSASESYRAPVNATSGAAVLCFDANTLMQKYRLRSGGMV
jgi:hypothetical protein